MSLVAVIAPVQDATVVPTFEAVERQTVVPERVVVLEKRSDMRKAVDASWVWLLDAGVAPEPDALERLIAATDGTEFALAVSKLLSSDGSLDAASNPVPEVHRADRVVAALARRGVPLRIARRGSMLVHRDALAASGALERLDRDLEWTARLLARRPGILEPASVAVRVAGRPATGVTDALRLLRALEPHERPWFGAHLAELAVASVRRG